MVIFEAARAITELNGVTTRELTPAITVLQLFLSSSKPVLRFAAVRTLNKVIHQCFHIRKTLSLFCKQIFELNSLMVLIFMPLKVVLIGYNINLLKLCN